jgi:hypothetical protein
MDGNKVLPMEIIYRSLRLHGGGFRKGTHHQQNQQQAGREEERKRGREDHKYILVLLRSKMSMAFFDVLWQYSE